MPAPRPPVNEYPKQAPGASPYTKDIGKGTTATYNLKGDTPDDNVGPVFDMFAQDEVEVYNPNVDSFNLGGQAGFANQRAGALAAGGQMVAGDIRNTGADAMRSGSVAATAYNGKGSGVAASQGRLADNYATQGQDGNAMQQARALGFGTMGAQGAAAGVNRAGTQGGQAANLQSMAYNQGQQYGDRSMLAGQRDGVTVRNDYEAQQNRQLEMQGRQQQLAAAQALGMRANDGSGMQNTQGLRSFASQTGQGPSAAQAQMQAGSDQSMASSLALARSGRGNNTGAIRQAAFQNAATQQATNQQLGTLRAQEYDQAQNRQLNALNAESQALQGYRGQDLNALQGAAGVLGQARGQDQSQQQLGIGQQQYNANLALENRKVNDQTSLAWAQQQQAAAARGDANFFQGQQLGNQSIAQGQQYNAQLQGLSQQASNAGQQYDLGKGQLANQALGQGQQFQLGMGGLANQANAQGQQYNLGAQGAANQYSLGMQGLAGQTLGQQLTADMSYEDMRSQNFMAAQQSNAQTDQARDAANVGMVGGLMQGLFMSDRRQKKDIEKGPTGGVVGELLGSALYGDDFEAPEYDAPEMAPIQTDSGGGMGGGMAGGFMGETLGPLLSDEHSKREIRRLNTELDKAYSALGGPERSAAYPETLAPDTRALDSAHALASNNYGAASDRSSYPTPRAPDVEALDAAARRDPTAPAIDLRAARGYSYRYKDPSAPGAAPGQQFGPMAQDLEKSPIGRSAVVEGPGGTKQVDPGRLTMINTAALSDQQRDIQAIKQALASNNQPDTAALDEAYTRQGGSVTKPGWRQQDPLAYGNSNWRYAPGF